MGFVYSKPCHGCSVHYFSSTELKSCNSRGCNKIVCKRCRGKCSTCSLLQGKRIIHCKNHYHSCIKDCHICGLKHCMDYTPLNAKWVGKRCSLMLKFEQVRVNKLPLDVWKCVLSYYFQTLHSNVNE